MATNIQKDAEASAPNTASTPLLAVFTTAIFLSAALLFAVQPMFAKMVLPRLGGAPAVWSVAIVFFQAALLCGYAYAHALTRHTSPRMAALIHLAVMAAAALTLPLAIAQGWSRPGAAAEALPPTWRDAATWVALSAVPSALLVAVTAHISTDVAAVPLLWVLPLALYLLTFVIVFAPRAVIPHRFVVEVQPAFVIALVAV